MNRIVNSIGWIELGVPSLFLLPISFIVELSVSISVYLRYHVYHVALFVAAVVLLCLFIVCYFIVIA